MTRSKVGDTTVDHIACTNSVRFQQVTKQALPNWPRAEMLSTILSQRFPTPSTSWRSKFTRLPVKCPGRLHRSFQPKPPRIFNPTSQFVVFWLTFLLIDLPFNTGRRYCSAAIMNIHVWSMLYVVWGPLLCKQAKGCESMIRFRGRPQQS